MKEFVEKLNKRMEEKIKVTSLEIIVTGTKDKPYFEIKYKEVGKEDYNIGYSSYDLNNVFSWKEECFEIVNQLAEEYNNTSADISIKQLDLSTQIADDLSKVLKEAKSMGCKGVKCFHHVPLENVEILINALKTYNQDSTKNNQGWIPCNERLPEKHGHYLVCSKDVIWVADYYNYTWWGVEKRCRWGDIEAWQPLPEPYKECEVKQGLYKLSQEPKTRIEHIRSMSVGELADAILERSEISTAIDYCQNFEECHEDVPEDECRKCLIQYLNSPVER